jgi:hypothetical protein
MAEVTTVVAGLAAAIGAVAAYRFAKKRAAAFRKVLRGARRGGNEEPVIDFERDPDTGVFRVK